MRVMQTFPMLRLMISWVLVVPGDEFSDHRFCYITPKSGNCQKCGINSIFVLKLFVLKKVHCLGVDLQHFCTLYRLCKPLLNQWPSSCSTPTMSWLWAPPVWVQKCHKVVHEYIRVNVHLAWPVRPTHNSERWQESEGPPPNRRSWRKACFNHGNRGRRRQFVDKKQQRRDINCCVIWDAHWISQRISLMRSLLFLSGIKHVNKPHQ